MAQYEYKVVPAPRKGLKAKGFKTSEARFSFALQEVMNQHGADGWDYLRAETLPSDERQGLTGSQTVYRDVLVFRRPRAQDEAPLNPIAIEHIPDATPDPAPEPDAEFQIAKDGGHDIDKPEPFPDYVGESDEDTPRSV